MKNLGFLFATLIVSSAVAQNKNTVWDRPTVKRNLDYVIDKSSVIARGRTLTIPSLAQIHTNPPISHTQTLARDLNLCISKAAVFNTVYNRAKEDGPNYAYTILDLFREIIRGIKIAGRSYSIFDKVLKSDFKIFCAYALNIADSAKLNSKHRFGKGLKDKDLTNLFKKGGDLEISTVLFKKYTKISEIDKNLISRIVELYVHGRNANLGQFKVVNFEHFKSLVHKMIKGFIDEVSILNKEKNSTQDR